MAPLTPFTTPWSGSGASHFGSGTGLSSSGAGHFGSGTGSRSPF